MSEIYTREDAARDLELILDGTEADLTDAQCDTVLEQIRDLTGQWDPSRIDANRFWAIVAAATERGEE